VELSKEMRTIKGCWGWKGDDESLDWSIELQLVVRSSPTLR